MNTGDFFDLGCQAIIHVRKAVSDNPIPPTDDKVISLRHVPEGISKSLNRYLEEKDHVGEPILIIDIHNTKSGRITLTIKPEDLKTKKNKQSLIIGRGDWYSDVILMPPCD